MNRPLNFAPVRALTAARFRVVIAVNLDDVPVRVLDAVFARNVVSVTQTHFFARRQAEILLRRVFHKVVALDVKRFRERDFARSVRFVFRVVDGGQRLRLAFRIVVDDQLDRVQHRHSSERRLVQDFAEAVFEDGRFDRAVELRDADRLAEETNRFRRVTAAAEPANRRHARVVPTGDVTALDEFDQLALAHHRVSQVQARELDLLRTINAEFVQEPFVQRTVMLEFERANRVRDPFDRVFETVRPVVHRVDVPLRPLTVVRRADDAVHHRVAHIEVRRRHVDLSAERFRAVRELAVAHSLEKVEVFFDGAVAPRARFARLGRRSAGFADLIGGQVANVSLPLLDELDGVLVHLLEVVRREEEAVFPIRAEPSDVFLDRFDVLDVFLRRVRVVETEVEEAAVLLSQTGV